MKQIPTKTTYLEMRSLSMHQRVDFLEGAQIEITLLDKPSTEQYRYLYKSVGESLNWVDRLIIPEEELLAAIHHPQVQIYQLNYQGQPAGFAELDFRTPEEVELLYFGLFPEYVGKGLGKAFLSYALLKAWVQNPKRVWVHTCDLDHPAALPTYEKAGFEMYDEKIIQQVVVE